MGWVMRQQMGRGHQHAWCADAALRSAALEKRLLQGMQLGVDGEAFDGLDARAAGLQISGTRQLFTKLAVHAHGARAALAFAAAFLGSSEA
jgi:hypothetical protein